MVKKLLLALITLCMLFAVLMTSGCDKADNESESSNISAEESKSPFDGYDDFYNGQSIRAVIDRTKYNYEDDIVVAIVSDNSKDILGTAPNDFYVEYWDGEKGEWVRCDKEFGVPEVWEEHQGMFFGRIGIKYRVDKGRLGAHRVAYELYSGEFGKLVAYSNIFEMVE